MEYDEIDQYVDQLFNKPQGGGNEPQSGEVLSGDWRIDRIDQVIQDTYDEAIWWHNNKIAEGTDPRSGLRGGLGFIPWDERIDGVIGCDPNAPVWNPNQVSNDDPRFRHSPAENNHRPEIWQGKRITQNQDAPLIWGAIVLLVIAGLLLFMMFYS